METEREKYVKEQYRYYVDEVIHDCGQKEKAMSFEEFLAFYNITDSTTNDELYDMFW